MYVTCEGKFQVQWFLANSQPVETSSLLWVGMEGAQDSYAP